MIRVPQEITEDEIISNNAPSVVALYAPATNYAIGADARVGNYVYRSVATPNTGKTPTENLGIFWMYWSPSNPHALFDLFQDTVTNFTADGIVVFKRGLKDTIGIGNFVATNIKIEYLDALNVVLLTENYSVPRRDVFDNYDLIYAAFNFDGSNYDTIFASIKKVGINIRVTIQNDTKATSCGYLVAGQAVYMGDTLADVSFPDRIIGTDTIAVANFDTSVSSNILLPTSDSAKRVRKIPMMFVIDDSTTSKFQNMVIIGKILKVEPRADSFDKNNISWEIEQNKEL